MFQKAERFAEHACHATLFLWGWFLIFLSTHLQARPHVQAETEALKDLYAYTHIYI